MLRKSYFFLERADEFRRRSSVGRLRGTGAWRETGIYINEFSENEARLEAWVHLAHRGRRRCGKGVFGNMIA